MQEPEVADTGENQEPDLERLWQFAGQGLRSSDFTSAMIHFYRGEMSRSNTWRSRLDMTTNWAVITTGAALTFAFGAPENTHLIVLVDTLLVLLFLFIEARRYRYYELWAYRVRLMETNFFAGLLAPPFVPTSGWAEKVAASLLRPSFPVSLGEAFGRRYRRNYAFIFLILASAWILKVWIHPTPARTLDQFLGHAQTGPIPGWLVITIGILFNGAILAIGLFTVRLRESTSEVLLAAGEPWHGRLRRRLRHLAWETFEIDLPRLHVPLLREAKQLVYIITDHEEEVSSALIEGLHRGVTRLEGTGMYTGRKHGVLMCAFRASQTPRLREIVQKIDPEAFVIITGVSEVRGEGFRPLEA
ncbi:MAG: DUF2270 domain-containing protein [Candidatus Promineifilaceae bacterium]|nr:DUF2270 domain-containing protein [Candidatus Promineifilaceae bacterium]